jgi:hypothetical protein
MIYQPQWFLKMYLEEGVKQLQKPRDNEYNNKNSFGV